MKKLIVMSCAIAMAACVNAAAVAWTSANVIYTPTSATDGTFTSTTAKSAGMTVLATIAFEAWNNETEKWEAMTLTQGTSNGDFTKGAKIKGATTDSIFEVGGKYRYDITYTGTLNGNNFVMVVEDQEFTFSAQTGNYALNAVDAGKWTPESVPEPTSGLLLLLGVAGLALRRRRA